MNLGEAPDATAVAALLTERWLGGDATLSAVDSLRDGRPTFRLTLERGARGARQRLTIELTHLRGAKPGEAWAELVDALDALLGQLVESGFAYRDLPVGSDVGFGDAVYRVDVSAARPELEAEADRLLGR